MGNLTRGRQGHYRSLRDQLSVKLFNKAVTEALLLILEAVPPFDHPTDSPDDSIVGFVVPYPGMLCSLGLPAKNDTPCRFKPLRSQPADMLRFRNTCNVSRMCCSETQQGFCDRWALDCCQVRPAANRARVSSITDRVKRRRLLDGEVRLGRAVSCNSVSC
ncbi:hypothetical protein VTI74DRAFT_681 [Chaetomium olivicolor]